MFITSCYLTKNETVFYSEELEPEEKLGFYR